MVDNDDDRGRCRKLGAEEREWSSTVHKEMRSAGFLVQPQNYG
jgi:hypothetical protein